MFSREIVDDQLDVDAWIDERIREFGYAQISHYDPTPGMPGLAFTIGLEQGRGVPELMCMGVDPEIASQLFSLVIEGHDAGVCDLTKDNRDLTGLIDGYALRLRPVSSALVQRANAVRQDQRPDVAVMLQVLLPDNSGAFPGDTGCDPQIAAAQDPDRLLAKATN